MLCGIFLFLNLFIPALGNCVSYGQCGLNEFGNYRNCLYDGPPKPLTDSDVIKNLKDLCPWYFTSKNETESLLCCDDDQASELITLAQLSQIVVSRCPACWRNLRTLICARACSPNQDAFEAATKVVDYVDDDGVERMAVTRTNLVMNYDYIDSILNSCKDVKFLGASVLIILCQSSECTPQLLAEALSDVELGAPHASDIYLTNKDEEIIDNKKFTPLQENTYRCEESIITSNELELPCTCSDCPKTCPVLEFDVPNTDMIGSITATEFIIIGLALVVIVATVMIVIHNISEKKATREDSSIGKFTSGYWRLRDKISKWLYLILSDSFFSLGLICSTYPIVTCIISMLCCTLLTLGLTHFTPTSDPVHIWGLEGGRCLKEKEYFDKSFGPFYRTTQVILVPKNQTPVEYNGKTYGPVFRQSILLELLEIQTAIKDLVVIEDNEFINLRDVCFAPLSPENTNCTIQDVAQYFQNDKNKIMQPDWMSHLLTCIDSYYNVECLSPYLSPVFPYVAFAGVPDNTDYLQSTALTITILNNNFLDSEKLNKVRLWESEYLKYMEKLESDQFHIYFNAERSAEDGVSNISQADVTTVLISYVVMFVYMSIFLSTFRDFSTVLIDLRVTLGFSCILMIILSVTSSFGFFSFLGYQTTLIVLEVTPFLILAIGSGDNFIFIKNFVTNFGDSTYPIQLQVALNLRQIGPSLLLSSSAQFVAFCIGAIIPVSSVRLFALYSAVAVAIKFCLQVTFFVAFFTLDCRRVNAFRFDIFCCIKRKSSQIHTKAEIFFQKLFTKFYTPVLLHKITRPLIMIAFTIWFIISLVFIPNIKIGLNLEIVFPDNSYTREYLSAVAKYSAVGPPIFYVIRNGYMYSNLSDQNGICSSAGCNSLSVLNQATLAADIANLTYISTPPTSWIDDYFSWISSESCCAVNQTTNEICPVNNHKDCIQCPIEPRPFNQRPKSTEFDRFLLDFLSRNPEVSCPKAGKALYSAAVQIDRSKNNSVGATNFMAYSAVQRTTEDSYKSLEASRHLSDLLSEYVISEVGFEPPDDGLNAVFLYSFVHIFYEQYIGISHTTMLNLIFCVIGVFVVTLILLGMDIQSSLAILIILILTIGQLMGSMYFANIDLNAISVVNLIMSIGIAVEFYVHMIRDFSVTKGDNFVERAKTVSNHIGVFIFIGITIPELVSVSTMSTANSELFRVYFFKMYLILILTCSLNGLVFIPVFLSYFGSALNERKLKMIYDNNCLKYLKAFERYNKTSMNISDFNEVMKNEDTKTEIENSVS